MRSQKRRCRFRSPSVKSIGCGRHGGSIEGKGGHAEQARKKKSESQGKLAQVTPRLSCVGVQVFAQWLDQQHAFAPVVAQLTQAVETSKQTHPGDDFALLQHREQTLLRRFQALFFAPLLGIDRLTEFDTREPPLATLLGRGYHSATLSQFLGQLERVDAAEVWLPALLPEPVGRIIYVDGHMIAYWSRQSLHKGKLTLLGRIMAGSQAVIAHDEAGQAVFVVYYPPDIHLSTIIVAYGQQVAEATGGTLFVIDRAVNAVALARAFNDQGLGLLCRLDDNEHAGLESFEATLVATLEDGTRVYSGPWKEPRPDEPRHFVIAQPPEDKTLVYWGTPKVEDALEPPQWPRVYRERNEMQAHSCKRMNDHGALKINYGRKKIVGPDRQQQRKQAKLDQALEAAHQRVAKKAEALQAQQSQRAESESKGHGKRLEQRQHALVVVEKDLQDAQNNPTKLTEQATAIGPPQERADRDFRKQTMMTFRTLLLENALMAVMAMLCEHLQTKVSLDGIVRILVERSGARMETPSQVVYWVNTAGLSLAYRRLLTEVVDGLGGMDLRHQGKPIRVCLKDMPP